MLTFFVFFNDAWESLVSSWIFVGKTGLITVLFDFFCCYL